MITVLLHVIPHNCSEMHRNVAIPDYRSLVTQTSWMDVCQIGYDICEFDSLRGLGINIIGRVHFDNQDRFSISMGSIGKAIEPCQQTTEWLLTSDFWLFLEPWYARWYEYEIFIFQCFKKKKKIFKSWQVYDWLAKWLIMSGYMDLRRPRVYRCSNVGLV